VADGGDLARQAERGREEFVVRNNARDEPQVACGRGVDDAAGEQQFGRRFAADDPRKIDLFPGVVSGAGGRVSVIISVALERSVTREPRSPTIDRNNTP
jgi:hypothetical protein